MFVLSNQFFYSMPHAEESDVIIIGAGPAGLATALGLAGSGLKVSVFDKDSFPRDKVCGGGLSSRSLRVIGDLIPDNRLQSSMVLIHGFGVTTPDRHEYHYLPGNPDEPVVMGATINRSRFDEALLDEVLQLPGVTFFPETEVDAVSITDEGASVTTARGTFHAAMVVMAGGAHSQLIDPYAGDPFNRKYDAIALRGIFKDIKPVAGENFVSFYFLKEVFPGYFWIFPSPGGLWNVGIYIPLRFSRQKEYNLNRLFFDIIQENSSLAVRFQDASLTGRIESDILPLGKRARRYSGTRWLSVGDAASLVDPLAGEGIGNALMSGQLAAKHLMNAFEANDFSASFHQQYDRDLMLRLKPEFRLRHRLIRFFGNKPRLFNLLFRQIARSSRFQSAIVKLLYNKPVPGRLTLPHPDL